MGNVAREGIRYIFVDTSAYYALVDAKSSDHDRAQDIPAEIARIKPAMFTTTFVLAVIHALVLRRLGSDAARRVLNDVGASAINVILLDESDEIRAREIIDQYRDKDFSYTDATSFAVMERLGIHHAFSFDRHFKQYKFITLDQIM
jgi:predicted nucleic acid-binding protein